MLPMPTLLIRFNIEKAGGAYGMACYERLFTALTADELEGVVLFDGDSSATLAGRENVNVIGVVCGDINRLEAMRKKLEADSEFMEYTASEPFILQSAGSSEPLVLAGNFSGGELSGGGWGAAALKAVKERRAKAAEAASQAPEQAVTETAPDTAAQAAAEPASAQETQAAPLSAAPETVHEPSTDTGSPFSGGNTAAQTPQSPQSSPFSGGSAPAQTNAQPQAQTNAQPQAAPSAPSAKAPKAPKAPPDPAKTAKTKRTLTLAGAVALALAWCAALCLLAPGAFKSSPVNYNSKKLSEAMPAAVIEACRRTGRSNEYIEAIVESCDFPDASELESMIGPRGKEDEGKPYIFTFELEVPDLVSLDEDAFDSDASPSKNLPEFKAQLADADATDYSVECLVDYDGIFFSPTQIKKLVDEGNYYLEDIFDLKQADAEAEDTDAPAAETEV